MATIDNDVVGAAVIHDNTTSGEQINNYQFQLTSGGPLDDADVLTDIAEILESLYNTLKTVIDIRNVLREVNLINITQDIILGSTGLDTYEGGESVAGAMPQGTAPHIYFKTAVPRVVLSKYFPSLAESGQSDDGRVTTGTQALLATMAAFLAATHVVNGHTWEYGYYSPKVLSFVLPTVAVVGNVFAYQRRRKEGSGS